MPLLSLTALAAPLGVGDPAPPLKPGKWMQGDPFTEFSRDKAYVVEFWGTWCGPCVKSIPHLNDISNKYKDKGLVVIGLSVMEKDESKLTGFIKEMGAKMSYHIAIDDEAVAPKGMMWTSWMEAAGQTGVPTAFLVGKDGRIAFIGHPNALEDRVIKAVLAGQFDISKAAAASLKKGKPTLAEPHSNPGPLNGVWINEDAATRSIPKVEIEGNQFVWWGRTHPQDSRYGPFILTLSGDSVEDSSPNKYGYLSESAGFADNIAILKSVGKKLVIEWLTIFKDGSGRSNYHETLTFTKSNLTDWKGLQTPSPK